MHSKRTRPYIYHVSILPQTPFPSRLTHNPEQRSMCYTVDQSSRTLDIGHEDCLGACGNGLQSGTETKTHSSSMLVLGTTDHLPPVLPDWTQRRCLFQVCQWTSGGLVCAFTLCHLPLASQASSKRPALRLLLPVGKTCEKVALENRCWRV